jgi:hypothetical protein
VVETTEIVLHRYHPSRILLDVSDVSTALQPLSKFLFALGRMMPFFPLLRVQLALQSMMNVGLFHD